MILRFAQDGAEHVLAALTSADTERVRSLFGGGNRPGKRLTADELKPVEDLLGPTGSVGAVAVRFGGPGMFPVRALLLDKSPEANWRLGWHQDRVVAVNERVEVPGFERWTIKDGQLHVQPPHAIIEGLVTLRVHADDVGPGNAPLRVLPGTHLLGRLQEEAVERLANSIEAHDCHASAGDVWVYRTPVVHASAEQHEPSRRRVLQLDFANFELPAGLGWAFQNPVKNAATLSPSASTA